MDFKLPVRNAVLDTSFHTEDEEVYDEREYAKWEDEHDSLRRFQEEFVIPSKEDLKRKKLSISEGMHACDTFFLLISGRHCQS
jgi:hypothetical protein